MGTFYTGKHFQENFEDPHYEVTPMQKRNVRKKDILSDE